MTPHTLETDTGRLVAGVVAAIVGAAAAAFSGGHLATPRVEIPTSVVVQLDERIEAKLDAIGNDVRDLRGRVTRLETVSAAPVAVSEDTDGR